MSKRSTQRLPATRNALAAFAALTTVASLAYSAPLHEGGDPTVGDLLLFPGVELTTNAADRSTSAPAAHWTLPRRVFRAGDGWWALLCDAKKCLLKPRALSVLATRAPNDSGNPGWGQALVWQSPSRQDGEETAPPLIWFKATGALAGLPLAEGPVKTWLHRALPTYAADGGAGVPSLHFKVGAQGVARLRLLKSTPQDQHDDMAHDTEPQLTLELRVGKISQRLGRVAGNADQSLHEPSTSVLWWAGDLDGDGRLDLLINHADGGYDSALYLSSLAPPGQLVGEAGRFVLHEPEGC